MLRRILGFLLLVSPVLSQQPAPWFEELKSGLADVAATARGNEDQRFEKFLELCWNYEMRDNPEDATFVGYPGQNDRWSDNSPAGIQRSYEAQRLIQKALAQIDRPKLSAVNQLNYDLFKRQADELVEAQRFPSELLPISQLNGVQTNAAQRFQVLPMSSRAAVEDYLKLLDRLDVVVRDQITLLREGVTRNVTQPQIVLRDVAQQVKAQIPDDPATSPLLQPLNRLPSLLSEDERAAIRARALQIYREKLAPAFTELQEFFTREYLPETRTSVAITSVADGKAWYEFLARRETTTDLTPQQVHELGMAEVRRIRAEMEDVIRQTGFRGGFKDFIQFLRIDPQFYCRSADELLSRYRDICKRVDPELVRLFGKLPRLPYGVKPVPAYNEKSQTTAYYFPGSIGTGRAGYFFANTYDLKMRPTYEMEALTLHEAVPGHHLQIALAQELENVPEFRKHTGPTAYVEGWGLYAESLGTELGLYQDPYSKFGQLTYEMWRAIRLVVDTGMHYLGWDRQRAIDFFRENAAKTEHDIVVEIDRYIAWPGQALAYKVGELKIKELRARAEKALGEKFDVRRFHDCVLAEGAIPLGVLERRIDQWIADEKARDSTAAAREMGR
jgi:uncharacterized protein (DUF885 family)